MRAALGASRGRLVAQLLTESFVLCLIGAAAGVGLAYLLIQVSTPLLGRPSSFNRVRRAGPASARVRCPAAVCVSLLVGLLPSLQMSAGRLSPALNLSTRGSSSREGVRRTIVIAEVAVSLILICGAILIFKSLLKLQAVDAGVRMDNVMTMSVDLALGRYPDSERAVQFVEQVVERLRAIPGVEQCGGIDGCAAARSRQGDSVAVPGVDQTVGARFKRVDPNYFTTLDIPLLAGRGFMAAIVLARRGWPSSTKRSRVRWRNASASLTRRRSVGRIVRLPHANVRESRSGGETGGYRDRRHHPQRARRRSGIADARGRLRCAAPGSAPGDEAARAHQQRPSAAMPAIREAVRQVDPTLPIGDVRTMAQVKELILSGKDAAGLDHRCVCRHRRALAALGLYGCSARRQPAPA